MRRFSGKHVVPELCKIISKTGPGPRKSLSAAKLQLAQHALLPALLGKIVYTTVDAYKLLYGGKEKSSSV